MAEASKVVLALGSNLGNREQTLQSAVEALKKTPGISKVKLSPMVESAAVTEEGIDHTRPVYLNAVVEIQTTLKPKELLSITQKIESDHGRVRLERWGSRTLDIDIVVFGNLIKAGKELTIPHPRAYERKFVLLPWSLLDPQAVLPGYGSVAKLAAETSDEVKVLA
jgi:2-amino-4-hydroxy-6-hydroxymethyldihydropteridine diphosphokinase